MKMEISFIVYRAVWMLYNEIHFFGGYPVYFPYFIVWAPPPQ